MKLSTQIVLITLLPILITIALSIFLQIYLHSRANQILQAIKDQVYHDYTTRHPSTADPVKRKIQQQIQYVAIEILALARLAKLQLINNSIPFNIEFLPPLLSLQQLNIQLEDKLQFINSYYNNNIAWDGWIYRNASTFNELSGLQQTKLDNLSYIAPLAHSITFMNRNIGWTLPINKLKYIFLQDGLTFSTPAEVIQMPNNTLTPNISLPAEYCGAVNNSDPRCQDYFKILLNDSSQGLYLFSPYTDASAPQSTLTQRLEYRSVENDSLFLSISTEIHLSFLQKQLSGRNGYQNLILLQSSSLNIIFAENVNVSTPITLFNFQLPGIDSKAQQQVIANIGNDLRRDHYAEAPDGVNASFASFISQNDPSIIGFTYNSTNYGLQLFGIRPVQIYVNSLDQATIDNCYILINMISQTQIISYATTRFATVSKVSAIMTSVCIVCASILLLWSIIFARKFAHSTEEPIVQMTMLLRQVESGCLQNQLQSMRNVRIDHINKIDNKFQLVLEKLITSKDIAVLHESISYLYQLIKFANIEYWQGSLEISMLKLAEAYSVYKHVGNKQGCSSTLFNLGNIHLLKYRYEEAEQAYKQSLAILDDIIISEMNSPPNCFSVSNSSNSPIHNQKYKSHPSEVSQKIEDDFNRIQCVESNDSHSLQPSSPGPIRQRQSTSKSPKIRCLLKQEFYPTHSTSPFTRRQKCSSPYFHYDYDIQAQRMCYLEALLCYKLERYYEAMKLLTEFLTTAQRYDRHHMNLTENLIKKISDQFKLPLTKRIPLNSAITLILHDMPYQCYQSTVYCINELLQEGIIPPQTQFQIVRFDQSVGNLIQIISNTKAEFVKNNFLLFQKQLLDLHCDEHVAYSHTSFWKALRKIIISNNEQSKLNKAHVVISFRWNQSGIQEPIQLLTLKQRQRAANDFYNLEQQLKNNDLYVFDLCYKSFEYSIKSDTNEHPEDKLDRNKYLSECNEQSEGEEYTAQSQYFKTLDTQTQLKNELRQLLYLEICQRQILIESF